MNDLTISKVQNKFYELIKICKKTNYKNTNEIDLNQEVWYDLQPHTRIRLQFGNRFGLLFISTSCLCCNCESITDYFINMTNYDLFVEKFLELSIKETKNQDVNLNKKEIIKLCLPYNSIGIFKLDSNINSKCNDEYILDVLSMVNDFNPDELSVKNMFEFLNRTIIIRTYFKKMYFRCYRKVFAPDKRGFLRDIKEFKKINKEL